MEPDVISPGRRDDAKPARTERPVRARSSAESASGRTARAAGGRSSALIRLQRTAGNHAVSALLEDHRAPTEGNGALRAVAPTVQRKPNKPKKKPPSTDPPQQQLAGIQGHAMDALLTELRELEPEVRGDEALGLAVGGTRLVMAMQTVATKIKGGAWNTFLESKRAELITWPPDQVGSILKYLGADEKKAMQQVVSGELQDIIKDPDGQWPMAAQGRTDLINLTVGEIFTKGIGHRTTTDLVADVRDKVKIALYMRATQQGKIGADKKVMKGFSYPNRKGDGTEGEQARVNEAAKAYWGPRQGGTDTYYFELSPAGKKNAYQAITSLFTEQAEPKLRTLIHCDYLVSIIEYRVWAESLGIEMFNKNVDNGNIPLVLKYDGFTELAKEIKVSDEKALKSEQPLKVVQVASESELMVGDHVVFWNHPTYEALTVGDPDVWKLENAIVVGADKSGFLFQGHGYPSPVPKSSMMEALCGKYNLHVARALALIKAEQFGKTKAARAKARKDRLKLYPNVRKNTDGAWEVVGHSDVTKGEARRALMNLLPQTAPGLRHPLDGTINVRRPVRD
jgi:hypothetical protein